MTKQDLINQYKDSLVTYHTNRLNGLDDLEFPVECFSKALDEYIIEFIKKQEGVVEGMNKGEICAHDQDGACYAGTYENELCRPSYNSALTDYKLSLQKEREDWQVLLDNK